MKLNIPKQTSEIFSLLSKGNFISSNGQHHRLIEIISQEGNFDALKEYFSHIRYSLERGFNYYYFSQQEENNTAIEKKLEQFSYYIDTLDFFSCLDNKPVVGTRYRITQLAEECYADERLRQKIFALSRREKLLDKITDIMDYMVAGSFFEKEDEDTYKVLDAIHYLEQVISLITIDDGQ